MRLKLRMVGAALLIAALLLGAWLLWRAPGPSGSETPSVNAPVTGRSEERPAAPPQPPQVVDSCEDTKDFLAKRFKGELPKEPLAPAPLSWDAGLTLAAGPEQEVTPGVFHLTPRQDLSIGARTLEVGGDERVQSFVVLPGDSGDVASLVWAGLDVEEAARFQPQTDALQAWKAYRNARLDLRIYRWSPSKSAYVVHQLLSLPPTCDAPFECGSEALFPAARVERVGSQYLVVRALERQGCEGTVEGCESVERMTLIALDADRSMTRLARVAIDVYTGMTPAALLMRNRYLSYRARFQDHNGDGVLDLSLIGHQEKLTSVDAQGVSVLSGVKRTMTNPVTLRYLRTPGGFVPVERTMSDLFEPAFNRAVKRLSAKRVLRATSFRALSEATHVLQVIAEAVAHASPSPPSHLSDPTLYCLVIDHEGQGPTCRSEGLGGALALDVDVIQRRALDIVRMWAAIRQDVPQDASERLDADLNRVFRSLCHARESALAKTSPPPPPTPSAATQGQASHAPTPVKIGAPGAELLPPAAPKPRQTPMPRAGKPRQGRGVSAGQDEEGQAPTLAPKTAPRGP